MKTISGTTISPGIAIGDALYFEQADFTFLQKHIDKNQSSLESQRLEKAFAQASTWFENRQQKITHSKIQTELQEIVAIQGMMLKDQAFLQETVDIVHQDGINAEWALSKARAKYQQIFLESDSDYFQERWDDVKDIFQQIFSALLGQENEVNFTTLSSQGKVIIATRLLPLDAVNLIEGRAGGFVLEKCGPTSHVAILTRAMGLPLLKGDAGLSSQVQDGEHLIVDCQQGLLVCSPDRASLESYRRRQKNNLKRTVINGTGTRKEDKTHSKDGKRIFLRANIELLQQLEDPLLQAADGIGLYRTEYQYMNTRDEYSISVEHLYRDYCRVVAAVSPHPVIVRTFDLGGDKLSSDQKEAENPALDLRAVRLYLLPADNPLHSKFKEMFKNQLRAILRASTQGDLRLMLPMISGVEEVEKIGEIIEEVKGELIVQGKEFNRQVKVGVMIEVPSATVVSDILAARTDFFSIGTNDLVQYLLAVDRSEEKMADLYLPHHPAVLRVLKQVIENGNRAGIEVSLCGEMAAREEYCPLLLGLGLDTFSVNLQALPRIKELISRISIKDAVRLANQALNQEKAAQVLQLCQEFPGGGGQR